MNNEQIIQKFREKLSKNRDTLFNREETMLIIKAESFILQVRTDTINEIRKEVEKFKYLMAHNGEGMINLEDIKTFLNKLDK